jgi:hypothetical protein
MAPRGGTYRSRAADVACRLASRVDGLAPMHITPARSAPSTSHGRDRTNNYIAGGPKSRGMSRLDLKNVGGRIWPKRTVSVRLVSLICPRL